MIDRANQMQTPLYRYNLDVLNETLLRAKREADQYDYHLHYAIKANADSVVLKEIVQHGIGADCVSGYEIKAALDAGFKPHQIAFAGVGKTDEEINYGLSQGIFSFNVESIPELEVINELAAKSNVTARVAIRVNPDVNAHTHAYITTGLEENKFGINAWEFEELIRILPELSHIRLEGLHVHIGSQITRMDSFKTMCIRVNEIVSWFGERGISFNHLNLGGGLGINYEKPDECPGFKEFFRTIHQFLDKQEHEVHFELGRSLVGQMGDLLTKVLYVKKGLRKHFAIVDAGMTELIRPALYQAFHKIESEKELKVDTLKYDVVGPICESSDCFGKEVSLPELKRGDFLKIRSVGAYGQVMSSQYNLRPLAETIYIKNNSEFKP